jgi:hypothetical protein
MKRIAYAVAVVALGLGAQAAWSGENITLPPEAYMNVAQMGSTTEGQVVVGAAKEGRGTRSLLEELGLAAHGPFPSRGGPIDD